MNIFQRYLLLITLLTVAVLSATNGAYANAKYASLIIDADSGKVLHAQNANAKRYPASLTKMMTLYLTFEALKDGKLELDTKMTVSKKAASMPQTNISLRKGDKLRVRDAIVALVVRSANDAAVVLAEQLGDTEWGFGLKMTKKARQLGMKSSVFRNASGLPDNKQHSTARDLALLAIALKRHFPEYYHFFQNDKFVYKGRTYKSHNRVMKQLDGADGLKTGYIRASGFNLVTSARREGRNLIGVVLGGKTSRSRDAHMVDLMERSFAKLNSTLNIKQFAQDAPTPTWRPGSTPPQSAVANKNSQLPEGATLQQASAHKAPTQNTPQYGRISLANAKISTKALTTQQPRGQFRPASLQGQQVQQLPAMRGWGIQVGAYQKPIEALAAAKSAATLIPKQVTGSKIIVTDGIEHAGTKVHRARLANLAEDQARKACQALIAMNRSCFVFRTQQQSQQL